MKLAVILGAGLGSRISSQTKCHPKGFIKVGPQTLIERSIEILKKHGIQKILIGTGHLSEWYENLASKTSSIKCVRNPDYATSGSLHTLCSLYREISEDFLLLESDLIYDEKAIQTLLSTNHDAILTSSTTYSGDEVYVETDSENFLVHLSKDKTKIRTVAGEFVGLNRLTLSSYRALCEWADSLSVQPPQLHYEEGLAALYPKVKIPTVKMEDLIWAEIDTEEHLHRVNTTIYPKLQGAGK